MVFNRYYSKQQGFLLPIALFLIVVASGAALVISKQLEQSALFSVDLILYDKSLYAAEAGAQLGINQLLFTIDSAKANHYKQCKALNINQVFKVMELKNCHIKVSCNSHSVSVDKYHYAIESEASCGTVHSTGDIAATDTLTETTTQQVIMSRVLKIQ